MQSLTVITAPTSRLLTKNLETGQSYGAVSKLRAAETRTFASLKALERILLELAKEPNKCVIRGELRPDAPTPLRRRRTHFSDEPQAWVMLDIDSVRLPKALRGMPYTGAHVAVALRQLPDAFQGAGCCWQASASAGTGSKLKLHLWFLLDAPLSSAQLRRWLAGAEAIDPATLRSVQPHYTADPIGGPYVGPRIGRIAGPRVVTPLDIDAEEPESVVAIDKRPKGCADVAAAQVEGAYAAAQRKARELIGNPTVAYMDAYIAGTHFGPAVALSTWNDRKHGHTSWADEAGRLSIKWGKRFAALPDVNQGLDVYIARVYEGIVWGLANERARLATRSQAVADTLAAASKAHLEAHLTRMAKNVGSESTMREIAAKIAPYRDLHPEIVKQFTKNSGFSEAQVSVEIDKVPALSADAWKAGLLIKKDGEIEATDANIQRIFNNYPGFASSFETNVRTKLPEATASNVLGLPVGVVDPETVSEALVTWLESLGMRKHTQHRAQSLFRVLMKRLPTYDPFLRLFPEAELPRKAARKALLGVESKLDAWLCAHFGVEDNVYTRAVGAKILIGAVARAVRAAEGGTQVDTMLVLVGEQGIGKTSALRTLGGVIPYGYTEMLDMREKDNVLAMHKSLVVEMAELRALRTSQEDSIKAFLTKVTDRLRAPYARDAEEMVRRMVFIGTTNDNDFLRDRTNRRYWPVVCTDISTLTATDAMGLWREAALRYAAGEQWWLNADEQVLQVLATQAHRADNSTEMNLKAWLKILEKNRFSFLDALNAAYPGVSDLHKYDTLVANALRTLGCKRVKTRTKNYWLRG